MSRLQPSPQPAPQQDEVPSLTIFGEMVGIEGVLPFAISRNDFVARSNAGQIRFQKQRRSLIHQETPDTEPHFRRPLLPLIEEEFRRRGGRVQSNESSMDVRSRLLVNNPGNNRSLRGDFRLAANRLPQSARDFLLPNQHALLEFSGPTDLANLIVAVADQFPQSRIAVLTNTHDSCWTLRGSINRFSRSTRAFVAFEKLEEDFFETRGWGNVPGIVIGTPISLANNNWFAGAWMFDLIVIVVPQLLQQEPILDYMISARAGTHVITCVSPMVACDPKWQPELFEYSGFVRGILAAGAEIFDVPRISYANINWNVSGALSLDGEVDFVGAIDTQNRRLRAIGDLLNGPRFDTGDGCIVLVFARRRSVVSFLRLHNHTSFRAIANNSESIAANERVVLTTEQLANIRPHGNTRVVWAGARALAGDPYRQVIPRLQAGATLEIVDVRDFPQASGDAQQEFRRTLRDWNHARGRAYKSLGYLPSEGTTKQHLLEQARRLFIRELPGGAQNV